MLKISSCIYLAAFLIFSSAAQASEDRVTILYDAFGKLPAFQNDWGFSALIEYRGKKILFDAGNDAQIFAKNVEAAGLDLTSLDFAVMSHRHLDHTAGLNYLEKAGVKIPVYVPKESFGVFGSSLPSSFYRKSETLPTEMRYFDGHPQETLGFGKAWGKLDFRPVAASLEVSPGVHIISLVSETPGTLELRELSLVLETPKGVVVVAGCSHPGIENIVKAAEEIDPQVYMAMGGFHLPTATDDVIHKIADSLHDELKVERLAPGHCTGEPAFDLFSKIWKEHYTYAGVGTVIELP